MSTSSYKLQKGRGLPWPLDTDAPSVADQAETPSEMEAALDVRQDEIAKSEILSGINRPSYDSLFAVAKNRVQLAILIMIVPSRRPKGLIGRMPTEKNLQKVFSCVRTSSKKVCSTQPTVSKALGELAHRGIIMKTDGVWVIVWAQLDIQAREAGWDPRADAGGEVGRESRTAEVSSARGQGLEGGWRVGRSEHEAGQRAGPRKVHELPRDAAGPSAAPRKGCRRHGRGPTVRPGCTGSPRTVRSPSRAGRRPSPHPAHDGAPQPKGPPTRRRTRNRAPPGRSRRAHRPGRAPAPSSHGRPATQSLSSRAWCKSLPTRDCQLNPTLTHTDEHNSPGGSP